jgi:hypothetical protein
VRATALDTVSIYADHQRLPELIDSVSKLRGDVSANVRCQLIVTLSRSGRIEFDVFTNDPFPEIRSLIKITNRESHLYNSFLSLILHPINHVIFNLSLTLSSCRPELYTGSVPVRLFPKKIDTFAKCQFSLSPVYSSTGPIITSNLCAPSSQIVLFGLSSGDLCVLHDSSFHHHSIGPSPICHVSHLHNCGFLVTFLATTDGYLNSFI